MSMGTLTLHKACNVVLATNQAYSVNVTCVQSLKVDFALSVVETALDKAVAKAFKLVDQCHWLVHLHMHV
jgi:hypothetical protein